MSTPHVMQNIDRVLQQHNRSRGTAAAAAVLDWLLPLKYGAPESLLFRVILKALSSLLVWLSSDGLARWLLFSDEISKRPSGIRQ